MRRASDAALATSLAGVRAVSNDGPARERLAIGPGPVTSLCRRTSQGKRVLAGLARRRPRSGHGGPGSRGEHSCCSRSRMARQAGCTGVDGRVAARERHRTPHTRCTATIAGRSSRGRGQTTVPYTNPGSSRVRFDAEWHDAAAPGGDTPSRALRCSVIVEWPFPRRGTETSRRRRAPARRPRSGRCRSGRSRRRCAGGTPPRTTGSCPSAAPAPPGQARRARARSHACWCA